MDHLHYKENTDEELMLIYQMNTDIKIFDELVYRYKESIVNYIYRFTNNISDAEDIAQDSFIKLYRFKDNFRNDSKFSTWFYSIVINTLRSNYNREKNYAYVSIEEVSEYELQTEDLIFEPEENETDDELQCRLECLERSFEQLDSIFKEPILLKFNEGFDYAKISEILSIPEGTVKSRINRGREHLKNIFVNLYNDSNESNE